MTARSLRGTFTSMEEMDSRSLFEAAVELDSTVGADWALAVLGFATRCMTQVGGHLDRAGKTLAAGGTPTTRGGRAASAIDALTRAAVDDSPANLLTAMHEMTRLPDVVLYRTELYEEMRRTLQQAVHSPGTSYTDLAWAVRDRTRRRGRAVPNRVVSCTLLVTGLEFEHAIVLDYNEFKSVKDKYVAITRPRRSLTVLLRGTST